MDACKSTGAEVKNVVTRILSPLRNFRPVQFETQSARDTERDAEGKSIRTKKTCDAFNELSLLGTSQEIDLLGIKAARLAIEKRYQMETYYSLISS